MKKMVFFTLMMALFAITVVGAQENWYITNREGGGKASNNQVRLSNRGENFVYIYFKEPKAEFDKIRLNFTIDQPSEVYWQAVYGTNALVLGWGELIGTIDKGPIETDLTSFTLVWSGRGPLRKSNVVGMCLKVNVPSGTRTFTMTEVQFLGLQQ